MKITCRICKIQQGEFFTLDSMVPIFGRREHKLLDIYNKCFHLNAFLHDALPQVVCSACFEKLKEFFQFQLKAEKSDLELRGNLSETVTNAIKTESLDNYNKINLSKSEKAIKTEVEVITTEDEFEDIEENCDEDERVYNDDDDEEELEDTDILFELYSKNDSCMEKYLKFEDYASEEIVEENIHKERDSKIKINLAENNIPLDITSSNESSTAVLESGETRGIPIEISRIELPKIQCNQVQTLIIEPLVEIRKWQCSDCGRKYITEEKLEQHSKLHKKSEDCQCEICGTHLKSLYEYKEHMKTHGMERKFYCEFCEKKFSTRANLKAHIYIHTNIRPFKCEICGKAFQQKSILKTHMTLHTGKPFECTLCHRRFSRTAHLNIHMRQHNNIRPYQCTQCSSSYMQKSHLDRHISSSHLGVRFQCTVCGKMYTKKPSLNTHMREAHSTTVSVLYNCEICNLDFAKQKGLYYHLKSKHPDYKKN